MSNSEMDNSFVGETTSPDFSLERGQNWIVGLDLGTTNSAISRIAVNQDTIEDLTVLQHVSENQLAKLNTLPSFVYIPGQHEIPEGALELPWDKELDYTVGEYARVQGCRIPGRIVSSAKSWLAHRRAEPTEPILPWEALKDTKKISAVEASKRYLVHLRQSFDEENPDTPLALQNIILTVPASFDEVGRELTTAAAYEAGLEKITLLEEPQAAFYAWLWDKKGQWKKELKGVKQILVCDIGGGTTDFTVIKVGEEHLERVAVGDHLMLGGDNLDIAIAALVEPRLKAELNILQWGVLRHETKRVKELLLGDNPPEECTLTVPGTGSKLLAQALTASVTRKEVEKLVLDGFFSMVSKDEPVINESKSGLREWGLPYAQDPVIPRHLAAFLRRHNLEPDAVLFNGGAVRPKAIRERICTLLTSWLGRSVKVLENKNPDLAVSHGAAAFGWLKMHKRERIRGGIARSYYLGLEDKKAICVIHRNQDETEPVDIKEPQLQLSVGRPVIFPLFSATDRPKDTLGQVVIQDKLSPLGSLETVIPGKKHQVQEIPVHLTAQVSEIGTLNIWASAADKSKRWKLELPLRGNTKAPAPLEYSKASLKKAQDLIQSVFKLKPNKITGDIVRPRTLLTSLEQELGDRNLWPLALNRMLWESFLSSAPRRRCSPEFEASWFNGAGFLLRPGIGYPLDKWRIEQMSILLNDWLQFSADERVRKEFWVFLRRIAAGLSQNTQNELWAHMSPRLIKGRKHIKSLIKEIYPGENTEFMRLAASLERISMDDKIALGDSICQRGKAKPEPSWQLARIGSRYLMGAGPQNVVPPEHVVPWVESLLEHQWTDVKTIGYALADMCRKTSNRALDLPESVRLKAAERLKMEGLPKEAEGLLEVTESGNENKARLLGEILPIGLRL